MSGEKKNCCKTCCSPCALCCEPLTKQCGLGCKDALDMDLDGQMWKKAFGSASGLGSLCLSNPLAFTIFRGLLFFFWVAVLIWSQVDWVNSYAPVAFNTTNLSVTFPNVVCPEDALKCSDGSFVGRYPPACDFAPCPIQYGYGFWYTQLTHWALSVELVYLCIAFVTTILANYSSIPDGTGADTPWFVSMTWALQPVALVLSFMVFVLYWALLWTPGSTIFAISVTTHGLNFAVMLIDFLICRQPFYLAHIYMPLAFALSYLIFSIIYYAAGGVNHQDLVSRYIYGVLDWGNPAAAGRLSAIIVLIVVPIVYALFVCTFLCRARCTKADSPKTASEV